MAGRSRGHGEKRCVNKPLRRGDLQMIIEFVLNLSCKLLQAWAEIWLWFLDIFVIPFAAVVLVTVYRAPRMIRKIRESKSDAAARGRCVKEFFHILLDLPCIAVAAALLCTWRLPFLASRFCRIFRGETFDDSGRRGPVDQDSMRGLPWAELYALIFHDIWVLVTLPFCLLPWRAITIGRSLSSIPRTCCRGSPHQKSRNLVDAYEFWSEWSWRLFITGISGVLDLLVGSIALLCCCTWRAPISARRIAVAITQKEDKNVHRSSDYWLSLCNRSLSFYHVVMWEAALFFADIPAILAAFVVIITGYRVPALIKLARKASLPGAGKNLIDTHSALRMVALQQGVRLLLDVVLLIPFLCVLMTGWRAKPLLKKMRDQLDRRRAKNELSNRGVDACEPWLEISAVDLLGVGWKTILLQFVLLILDVVALPLLLVLILTVWRLPSFMSSLAAAGNPRKFFAVTVFLEFFHLLVDIPCIFIFVLLFMLRPIGAVTLLLEDQRHRRRRLLIERNGEIQDLICSRPAMQHTLEDMLSVLLKMGHVPPGLRSGVLRQHDYYGDGSPNIGKADFYKPYEFMQNIQTEYIGRLESHQKRADIWRDKQYSHLLKQVIAIERKRARKLTRRAHAEFVYMTRPDTAVRERNVSLLEREFHDFCAESDAAFHALQNYRPKAVPLYDTQTGLSQRSRGATQNVLLEIATTGYIAEVIMCALAMVPLYRFPQLVSQTRKHWWNRRSIMANVLLEYAKDLCAVICSLVVICGLYRSLDLISDVTAALFEERSWSSARKAVWKHFASLGEDLIELMTLAVQWSTYSFTFLALLWGVLVPIDLFQPIAGTIVAVLLWAATISFPFAFSFSFSQHWVESGAPAMVGGIVGYIILLLALVVLSIRGMCYANEHILNMQNRHEQHTYFAPPRKHQIFRLNWENFDAIFAEIVDFLQISALVLQVGAPTMIHGQEIAKRSDMLLLDFLDHESKFWLVVALTLVWYIVASAPPVLEEIMNKFDNGAISRKIVWRMAMYFFCDTLLITVSQACMEQVACDYSHSEQAGRLAYDHTTECWKGDHRYKAAFALFILMWYTTTTVLYIAKFDVASERLDLQYSSLYVAVNNILKIMMVTSAVIVGLEYKVLALSFLTALNIIGLLFVLGFARCVGYPICNMRIGVYMKGTSFCATAWLAISALSGATNGGSNSSMPTIMWLVGWGGLILLIFVISMLKGLPDNSEESKARENFRETLLKLERRLLNQGKMLHLYTAQNQRIRRGVLWKIRNARAPKAISREDHDLGYYVTVTDVRTENQNINPLLNEPFGLPPEVSGMPDGFMYINMTPPSGGGRFGNKPLLTTGGNSESTSASHGSTGMSLARQIISSAGNAASTLTGYFRSGLASTSTKTGENGQLGTCNPRFADERFDEDLERIDSGRSCSYSDAISRIGGRMSKRDLTAMQKYIHGPISREEANKLCFDASFANKSGDGAFLVREAKDKKNTYILTVIFRGMGTHHEISTDSDGIYLIDNKNIDSPKSIHQLIVALSQKRSDWPVPLTFPVADPDIKNHIDAVESTVFQSTQPAVTDGEVKLPSEPNEETKVPTIDASLPTARIGRSEPLLRPDTTIVTILQEANGFSSAPHEENLPDLPPLGLGQVVTKDAVEDGLDFETCPRIKAGKCPWRVVEAIGDATQPVWSKSDGRFSAVDGQTALLKLEFYIRHDALSLSWLSRSNHWRKAVERSTWTGLVECIHILEAGLGSEAQPKGEYLNIDETMAVPACGTDNLSPDADKLELPPFFEVSSLPVEVRFERSRNLKRRLLEDLRRRYVMDPIIELLDSIIPGNLIDVVHFPPNQDDPVPSTQVPVPTRSQTDEDLDGALPRYTALELPSTLEPSSLEHSAPGYDAGTGSSQNITVDLVLDAKGIITTGVKQAIGGFVLLRDRFSIQYIQGSRLQKTASITFGKGSVKVGKGPLSVELLNLMHVPADIGQDDDQISVTFRSAFGDKTKRVKMSKIKSTLKELNWG